MIYVSIILGFEDLTPYRIYWFNIRLTWFYILTNFFSFYQFYNIRVRKTSKWCKVNNFNYCKYLQEMSRQNYCLYTSFHFIESCYHMLGRSNTTTFWKEEIFLQRFINPCSPATEQRSLWKVIENMLIDSTFCDNICTQIIFIPIGVFIR